MKGRLLSWTVLRWPWAAAGTAATTTNDPPAARFTPNCADLTCDFDASGSSDGDGQITDYAWDFGDGDLGSGEMVQHTYAAGGEYTVTLTVTDDDQATDVASQQVAIPEPDGGGGGDTAPAIDQFDVDRRTTGPWVRADITWSVSDIDGDLAQVTSAVVDASDNVLDSETSLVSGADASGVHSLRIRSTPAEVVLIVSDANGNITTQRVAY